jgi:hypothetical protein
MSTVYTATTVIGATPDDVYAFMCVPENQLTWSAFVKSTRPLGDGWNEMENMFGQLVRYRLECDPSTRCVDIVMETPRGLSLLPTRATPHSRGAMFSFTIVRPPGIGDDDWARSCAGLEGEVATLKGVVESRVAVAA